jgi:hypothetical protein
MLLFVLSAGLSLLPSAAGLAQVPPGDRRAVFLGDYSLKGKVKIRGLIGGVYPFNKDVNPTIHVRVVAADEPDAARVIINNEGHTCVLNAWAVAADTLLMPAGQSCAQDIPGQISANLTSTISRALLKKQQGHTQLSVQVAVSGTV